MKRLLLVLYSIAFCVVVVSFWYNLLFNDLTITEKVLMGIATFLTISIITRVIDCLENDND